MITERMTALEIQKEMLADLENVLNYGESKLAKFRRIVIKANKFPVFAYSMFTSKRKNKWIILLKAYNKKDINAFVKSTAVSYYNSNHGYYAAALNNISINIYTPHFFSRYAERKKIDLHGVNLMLHYFRNNGNIGYSEKEVTLPDGSKQIVVEGTTEEGIVLGLLKENDIILAKTFITKEMVKGGQIETLTINEKSRQKIDFIEPISEIFIPSWLEE